ncbi:hypothetical protein P5673_022008 [Acropora cervicornis]|uniref:Uncharacterized protein n=1 Tax=Acropora cervicornis TaxID=6130 RepID=A0AAD9Q813_ACRCE|nr:hypothetical protein P5673_022008 [Acropora cervicornis]
MCVVEAALTGVVVVETLVPAESQAVINKDSVGSSTEMCAEDNSRSSIGNPCHSLVDNSTLFHCCTQLADRHASYSESFSSESDSSNSEQSPSTSSTIGPVGPRDPLHPSVRSLLSFLHSLFKKGLSYSALNTARSAVSSIDINVSDVQDHTPVGKHFLVCRYLKGVFNKIKPVPRYNNIWSVDTVLDYLSLFWPLDEINLKELTLKLVMLIALTTGQRCQTLTFLDISE